MGLALTAQAERPLKERVSLEGSARKFWQFEINPEFLALFQTKNDIFHNRLQI